MMFESFQIIVQKTTRRTSHLGMEYCVMKLAEALGKLDEAIGSGNRDSIKLEGGGVFWHLADIYTRYGVVITYQLEEAALRRVDHIDDYAINRHLARASGAMCGAVAEGLSKGVGPRRDAILVHADIVLALTFRILRCFNHSVDDVLLAHVAPAMLAGRY